MDRTVRARVFDSASADRLAGGWRWAVSQPSWIVRCGLVAFLLIVVVPVLLLAGIAALVAAVVFGGLALLNGGVAALRRLGRGDGRSNVRVIRPADRDRTGL
jgi:hypothetical protein